jgi:cytochrome c oxidase subunit IV
MTTVEKGAEPGMKVYVSVWLGMLVIVAIEATLVYLRVSTGMLVASLLVLAFFEAAVALRYFMHLQYEVPLLFWTLIPGLLLAFFMMNQFWADAARLNALRFPVP